jgi:hypothetical protein
MPSTYQEILQALRKRNAEHEERVQALSLAANAIFASVTEKIGVPDEMIEYALSSNGVQQESGMPRRDMDITIRFPGIGETDLYIYRTTVFLQHNGAGVTASLQTEQEVFEVVQGGPGLLAIGLAVDRGLRSEISRKM